jgi:hypothetical protein
MIDDFRGKYFYLSNFSPCPFTDNFGVRWTTSEHYYQAHKCLNKKDIILIHTAKTPGDAKKIGRFVKQSLAFQDKKFEIMWIALQYKFVQNPEIRNRLLDTGREILIEGNKHHDNIWGDCRCSQCEHIKGENHLGIQLMQLREIFQKGGL